MKTKQSKTWQTDPQNIETETVQAWCKNGGMLTAQMTRERARELVRLGRAFVISVQAIGYYDN